MDDGASKVERSKSTYAVPVARWDRDEKHRRRALSASETLRSIRRHRIITPASTRPSSSRERR